MEETNLNTLNEIIAHLEKLEAQKLQISRQLKKTYALATELGFEKDILKEILDINKARKSSAPRLQELYNNLVKWKTR